MSYDVSPPSPLPPIPCVLWSKKQVIVERSNQYINPQNDLSFPNDVWCHVWNRVNLIKQLSSDLWLNHRERERERERKKERAGDKERYLQSSIKLIKITAFLKISAAVHCSIQKNKWCILRLVDFIRKQPVLTRPTCSSQNWGVLSSNSHKK